MERIFEMKDQRDFAALSGDHNPIHVDEVAARRLLFGAPVVHGVHLVLWALDRILASGRAIPALSGLTAEFRTPVLVGDSVTLELSGTSATLSVQGRLSAMIALDPLATEAPDAWPEPEDAPSAEASPVPANLTFSQMETAAGHVPARFERARRAALYPALSALPAQQVAALLASTRIVGMECPGLHSLYSELRLTFQPGAEAGGFDWRTGYAHPDLRIVQIFMQGGGVDGQLTAFMRPEPVRQITAAEACAHVTGGSWSGRHALVVGGSRGLGEVTAKLLAAAGAKVTVSYSHGRVDAEAIVSDITAAGGQAVLSPLDVRDPNSALPGGDVSDLFYFASPKIRQGAAAGFDDALFSVYREVFLSGFLRLAAAMPEGAGVFYPSTVFVDEFEPRFAEYAAAKAAAETAARYLAAARPDLTVLTPRLPRARTDQNAAIVDITAADPVDILREALTAFRPQG